MVLRMQFQLLDCRITSDRQNIYIYKSELQHPLNLILRHVPPIKIFVYITKGDIRVPPAGF